MRFCRLLPLEDKNEVVLLNNELISWDLKEKPIVLHLANTVLVFLVEGDNEYRKWTSAFESL